MSYWKRAGFAFLAGAVLWFPITSLLTCLQLHRWDLSPGVMLTAAFYFWRDYSWEPHVAHALRVGALAGLVAPFGSLTLALVYSPQDKIREARPDEAVPSPRRAYSGTYGSASWVSEKDMLKIFPGGHPVYGAVVVGEAYRVDLDKTSQVRFDEEDPATWGRGGSAPLLLDPCTRGSTHATVFAGSGGFKTTAIVIPTLLHWIGSGVVFDPPGKVSRMVIPFRRSIGHKVYRIASNKQGVNVLGWIDTTNPTAETNVLDVLNWIGGDIGDKAHGSNGDFAQSGRKLLACLLADMLWDPNLPAARKTLRDLRARATTPENEMRRLLEGISEESASPMARDYARSLMRIHPKTFSGAYFHATAETDFLAIKAYADLLSNPDCDPSCICTGRSTVFVEVSMSDLAAAPALGRVLISTFQSALRRADGKVATERVLFLLDEARFLGRLSTLSAMMTADRKYGATVVTLWQDETDLKAIWKEHAGIFAANSAWTMYAAVNDRPTSDQVSALSGKYTVISRTQGSSTSRSASGSNSAGEGRGSTQGLSEQSAELIKPEQVRTLRPDEAIVFRVGEKPMRCGRALYFRREEMRALVPIDRTQSAAA